MKKEKQSTTKMSRRDFLSTGAAAVGAFTVIPTHVFAARKHGQVAPSDRIRLLHIGCGSQGLAELGALLKAPAIDIVGVADPNRESYNYIHWSKYGLRNDLRKLMDEPAWKEGVEGIPGGRNVMKEVIETYYRKNRPGYKGSVAAAEDYRELLETLKDVDAVKIMSPDHHHAFQAIDCLKRGKHVIMHKPLGNKMAEAMKVVDTAKASPLSTYMLAYNAMGDGKYLDQIKKWIEAGAIGKLKEIHNWSNRPVWPQYPVIPAEKEPVPEGLNWDIWLGPAEMRDYHFEYTHCCFRGWYEFGAGSIADMGYYSLWPVFRALNLGSAVSAVTRFSRVVTLKDHVPSAIENDYSYPMAAAYRFEIPYRGSSEKVILQWHDGGMKPQVPDGYEGDELPIEGMMFTGERGAIVCDFQGTNPALVGEYARQFADLKGEPLVEKPDDLLPDGTVRWLQNWMDACRGKGKRPACFENAREVNETFNLGSVSLMRQGKKLTYDPRTRTVTNDEEANRLLARKVRKGWEI